MNYPQAQDYLNSFINYEKIAFYPYNQSLKLTRVKDFLHTIGNPQEALQCIHIAGTKGKGSTCAFIAYILKQAGYKVGLYTSPHLSDFRERIRILNQPVNPSTRHQKNKIFAGMITKDEVVNLVERLKPAIEKYNQDSKYQALSFFEVYTSLAFTYFKEQKVDFAVLETGLGGRLDATNVVNPLVCALTPISYEHTQKLGSTLRQIAAEKAGIIKDHRLKTKDHRLIAITAPQEKEALEVIREKCQTARLKLYEIGKDIVYQKSKAGFTVKGLVGEYPDLQINLLGKHQLINATLAVGVIEALKSYGINVGIDVIKAGLKDTLWPGRCEVIAEQPLVVLDGAQNGASSLALKKTIKENFSAASAAGGKGRKYQKLILVLGISQDKDIKAICENLLPLADKLILTEAANPRAASADDIEEIIKLQAASCKLQAIKTKNIKEAMVLAKEMAAKEDLILVTGSLFVVGEARELFLENFTL